MLEQIRIATPCKADWNEMSGDARVRFCGQCEKNVYNLSEMTRDEAEKLVREKEGRLCVRLFKRQDGTVLTADCPVGVRRERLRQRAWQWVCGAVATLMLLFAGRARADLALKDGKKRVHLTVVQPHSVTMGGPMPSPAPKHELMGKPVFQPEEFEMGDVLVEQPVVIQKKIEPIVIQKK